MPEINLPTKATQDAIKQDIADILSQFPISGGTDLSGGIFFSNTVTANNGNPEMILMDVEGKGFISHLQILFSSANDNTVKIETGNSDPIIFSGLANTTGNVVNITPFIYFDSSCKVTVIRGTPNNSIRALIIYAILP